MSNAVRRPSGPRYDLEMPCMSSMISDSLFTENDRRILLRGEHGREHRELRDRVTRLETHAGLPPYSTSD